MATAADISELLATHPRPSEVDREALARCIAECYDCARSCTICADADLAEEDVAGCGGAFVSAWTAPTSASRPAARSAARRNTSRRPRGQRSRAAGNPARPAPRSANATPSIMSIAGSALKAAAVARQPAPPCSTRSEFLRCDAEALAAAGIERDTRRAHMWCSERTRACARRSRATGSGRGPGAWEGER